MKRKLKRLALSRETLGKLSSDELSMVEAGAGIGSAMTNCDICDKLPKPPA